MSDLVQIANKDFKKYSLDDLALFTSSSKVPPLPLPTLSSTIRRLKQIVYPYATNQGDFESFEKACKQFQKKQGLKLQAILEQRKFSEKGWLADLWQYSQYFIPNTPTAFYINPTMTLDTEQLINKSTEMCEKASRYISSSVHFFKNMLEDQMVPSKIKQRYLCPEQYRYMFNCCRIPGKKYDHTLIYPYLECNYCIILCRNRFFKIQVINNKNSLLSKKSIKKQLQDIVKYTQDHPLIQNGVGCLSALPRRQWAKAREILTKDPHNKSCLQEIEACLFIVCLEPDTKIQGSKQQLQFFYTGQNGQNKFFDKSFCFIFTANGKASFMYEHSKVDGTIYKDFLTGIANIYQKEHEKKQGESLISDVQQLSFRLNDKSILELNRAAKYIKEILPKFEIFEWVFDKFGVKKIKHLGFHPDTFIYLAMTLAFYKMNKQLPVMYRPGLLRFFKYGRTQNSRFITLETLKWVKAMQHKNLSNESKLQLLNEAASAGEKRNRDIMEGICIDRHLTTLMSLCKQDQIPELFEHKLFKKIYDFDLITSSMLALIENSNHSSCFSTYGGNERSFGICIHPRQEKMAFIYTKQGKSNEKFFEQLEKAFQQIQDIIPKGKL